jgi:hypothetical protein
VGAIKIVLYPATIGVRINPQAIKIKRRTAIATLLIGTGTIAIVCCGTAGATGSTGAAAKWTFVKLLNNS